MDIRTPTVTPDSPVEWLTGEDRYGRIQVIRDEITVGAVVLNAGDGAAISGESAVTLKANDDAELLLLG